MGNEFEEAAQEEPAVSEDEFKDDDAPPGEASQDMIASGAMGQEYDWSKAPEQGRAPPRIELNGQTVTIRKADIVLPPASQDWDKTRDGKKDYKYCRFILFFDKDNQQEAFSGVRVFKREEKGEDKYSHPSMTRDRKNQASALLGLYADKVEKDINEIGLREFLAFLNSKPKALIKTVDVKNPSTNEVIRKNTIEKFI